MKVDSFFCALKNKIRKIVINKICVMFSFIVRFVKTVKLKKEKKTSMSVQQCYKVMLYFIFYQQCLAEHSHHFSKPKFPHQRSQCKQT